MSENETESESKRRREEEKESERERDTQQTTDLGGGFRSGRDAAESTKCPEGWHCSAGSTRARRIC